jgi:tyrosinase
MICRKSVAVLSPQEKADFVAAVLDLKNPAAAPSRIPAAAAAVTAAGGTPNRYDDYVWVHNTVGTGAHRGSAFGPWHREFLRQFEFDLGQVSGDPHMAIPYWDWTVDQTPAAAGWPFTADFLGGFGNALTGIIATGLFANPATFRINIRRQGDTDIALKRSRGIPAGNVLPDRADVLHALGVAVVPAGTPWPSVYDAVPFNGNPPGTVAERTAQANAAFRKYLEWVLHDGIHVWIGDVWDFVGQVPRNGGHMSFPSVSVNDPVFWLHHANVDRLWAIWQRKSPTPAYVPMAAGTASPGHNGPDVMVNLGVPAHFASPLNEHPADVQDHHALGVWYHTDPPEITLSTPSVDFGDVPETQSVVQPVQFAVRTCQPVQFGITAVTGANFAEQAGQGTVTVDHDHSAETQTASVHVQFTANGTLGAPQSGTVSVEATIVDRDGYDTASPGDDRVVGSWTIDLTATPVATQPAEEELAMHDHGTHDHSQPFEVFRRNAEGEIVAVAPGALERSTGDYVKDDDVTEAVTPRQPASPGSHGHDD